MAGGSTSAELSRSVADYLRGQHRRLQQALALLALDGPCDAGVIVRVTGEVARHHSAEEGFLYPLLDQASPSTLSARCAVHGALDAALADLSAPMQSAGQKRALVGALEEAFRLHTEVVDRVALPWIEATLSAEALEHLRLQLMTTTTTPQ